MRKGDIWWAELPEPEGSGPAHRRPLAAGYGGQGYRRPVLVVQADDFNRSRINTVIVAVLTSNLALAPAPGNVLVKAERSGLPKDSVVNVSQLITLDKRFLTERVKSLDQQTLVEVDNGLRLILEL
ncbi:MAG: type II toxin-antitoxin system PemK/MazF family toxin [Kiritimatiellia bacterium]|nr:type II toxin-antitoxin system PemK/MazF family toxin [Kiritimatiellia bacterium]